MKQKKILIFTDAWFPQVNGVVKTYDNTIKELQKLGHELEIIHPNLFKNCACPLYPEIRLAFPFQKTLLNRIKNFAPDHIHIATEGPIGKQARAVCIKQNYNFSTSFHTMFPEYLQALAGVPASLTWKVFRWFHYKASCTMAPTQYIVDLLKGKGFQNLRVWSRGIHQDLFYPHENILDKEQRPVLLYVGRVSKEKNIEAFLELDLPGVKYVVGDGPSREQLESKFTNVKFVGYQKGHDLAGYFSSADVFVFPSKTDTFGNVVLEALACGVPVAAYPLAGPLELIKDARLGCVSDDLKTAVLEALKNGDGQHCASFAKNYSWENASLQFIEGLVPIS